MQSTPPADDPGWANVVSPKGCSGVYLGNQWVITAGHVGAGSVTIGGTAYAVQPGASIRLRTPDGSGVTDLTMFRLAADPGLASLEIISNALPADTSVTMIGYGKTRGAAVYYDSAWLPVTSSDSPAYAGYVWSTATKCWGTNRTGTVVSGSDGYGVIVAYETIFSAPGEGGTANEAQGATYDSGGGLFAKVANEWQLAGIMVTIGRHPNQPGSTGLFGNTTYSMELATYRPQIEAVRALAAPLDIWWYSTFRDTATDANGDADGDGFANFVEFAYGLDPAVADAASAGPQVALAAYADGNALTATYTRNTAATDVPVVVEVSGDLVTWEFGDTVTSTVSSTSVGTNVVQLVVRDLVTTETGERRFMRVRVGK